MYKVNFSNLKSNMKQLGIINLLMILEFVMCIAICIASVLNIPMIQSVLHLLIYAVLFVMFAIQLIGMIRKKEHVDSLFVLFAVTTVLAVAIITVEYFVKKETSSFSPSYYTNFIFFISTLLLFYVIYRAKFNLKTVNTLIYLTMAASLLMVIFYFVLGEKAYIFHGYVSRYLTLNMGNPNKTAIVLFLLFLYMFLGIFIIRKKWIKFLCGMMAAFLLYMIYKTYSRNILIVSTCFLFFIPWLICTKRNRLNNLFWDLVFLLPILFVIVYMLLIENDVLVKLFGFMISDGKDLSSRQKVWQFALDYINQNPIWGSYFEIWSDIESEYQNNMHNSLLGVLTTYGSIVFIVFSVYMYEVFRKFNALCNLKIQNIALWSFGMALLIGLGESCLFAGSAGLFILCGGLLTIVKACPDVKLLNENDKKE